MRHGLLWTTATTLAFLVVGGSEADAQMVTLDEGTFRITVDGAPVGTERFSIRRSGGDADAQVIATAEIRLQLAEGRLDLYPALQLSATTGMEVSAYQIRISGYEQQEIFVTSGDRRFRTSVRSERGEQERELRSAPGTFLLDDGVAHQYYFLAQRLPPTGSAVPVIVPRTSTQHDLRVSEVGPRTLTIGGNEVSATLLRLEGNREVRQLWIDREGRVLALEHPASGYRATRERAP